MNNIEICTNCEKEIAMENHTLCLECNEYYQEYCKQAYDGTEEEYITVTREMARDAQFPEMEGQLWRW